MAYCLPSAPGLVCGQAEIVAEERIAPIQLRRAQQQLDRSLGLPCGALDGAEQVQGG